MTDVHPTVRYLIVCEDVIADPDNPLRVSLIGLIGGIRSLEEPPFPFLYEEFCVFIQLTECRGPADGRIEIRQADSDEIVFRSQIRTMELSRDPLEVLGVVFRIHDCVFTEPGLYWVRFCYNDEVLAQQSIVLR